MTNTLTSYMLLSRNLATSLQRKGKDPIVARETAYYQANIGKVKSIDDFMADSRLYNYAMKAYGLEDMATPRRSCARCSPRHEQHHRLRQPPGDDRYVAFAKAYTSRPAPPRRVPTRSWSRRPS